MGRSIKFKINPGEFDFSPPEFPFPRIYPKEVCRLVTFHENCKEVLPHPHNHSWLKLFGLSFGIRGIWNHHINSIMAAYRYHEPSDKIQLTIYGHVAGQVFKGDQGIDIPLQSIDVETPVFCRLKVDRRQELFSLTTQTAGSEVHRATLKMNPLIMSVYWHSKDLGLYHGGQLPAQQYHEITKKRLTKYPDFVSSTF